MLDSLEHVVYGVLFPSRPKHQPSTTPNDTRHSGQKCNDLSVSVRIDVPTSPHGTVPLFQKLLTRLFSSMDVRIATAATAIATTTKAAPVLVRVPTLSCSYACCRGVKVPPPLVDYQVPGTLFFYYYIFRSRSQTLVKA